MADPHASVVIRSFNRVPALCELLEALLAQRADGFEFEVVVVEQSQDVPAADGERLDALARDPRVRILRHPPLGGARARNVGAFAARGDILIFVDDDDLPVGEGWMAAHLAAYADPACIGVSGRQEIGPGERTSRLYRFLAARRCLSFSPLLKLPLTYVRHLTRIAPVEAVHGTNGSIRRSLLERFGGWDEDTSIEDEASFCFKVQKGKRPEEYFAFEPGPLLRRRMDMPGGLNKRYLTAGQFYGRFMGFVHRIVRRYFPRRVPLLYPLYLAAGWSWTLEWIWSESQGYRTFGRRLWASLGLTVGLPLHALRALAAARVNR